MFRSPSAAGLPGLAVMLADLPANQQEIARHLGITPRTLQRYKETGSAPRAVMLALFWETRWGRSAADCEAANWGAMHYRRAMVAERQSAELRRQLERAEADRSNSGGAANAPTFRTA